MMMLSRLSSIALFFCCLAASAQETSIPLRLTDFSMTRLPGQGARAMGMAGAFTAVADDASAGAYNPAGLAELEHRQVSFAYGSQDTDSKVRDALLHETSQSPFYDLVELRYDGAGTFEAQGPSSLEVTHPFRIGEHRLAAQLAWRRVLALPDGSQDYLGGGTVIPAPFPTTIRWSRSATASDGVESLAASLAWRVSEAFSVGATIHRYDGQLERESRFGQNTVGPGGYTPAFVQTQDSSFEGWSADLGLLWRALPRLTFGAVWFGGFSADWTSTIVNRAVCDLEPCLVHRRAIERGDLRWPDSWTLGAAYRPTERLTLSLDYGERQWGSATLRGGVEDVDPATGEVWRTSRLDTFFPYTSFPGRSDQKDTTTLRLGGEYRLPLRSLQVAFRVGLFREELLASQWGLPLYAGLARAAELGDPLVPRFFTFDQFEVQRAGLELEGYSLGAGLEVPVGDAVLAFDLAWVHGKAKDELRTLTSGLEVDIVPAVPFREEFHGLLDLETEELLASAAIRF